MKNILPDMTDEIAAKFYINRIIDSQKFEEQFNKIYAIAFLFLFIAISLNIVLFEFQNEFSLLQLFLFLGIGIPMNLFWVINVFRCWNYTKNQIKAESEAIFVKKEFPGLGKFIKEKQEENISFDLAYSGIRNLNLYFRSFVNLLIISPILIFSLLIPKFHNFDQITIILAMVYFIVGLYCAIFISLKRIKNKNIKTGKEMTLEIEE